MEVSEINKVVVVERKNRGGLEGIVAATTALSQVEGEVGRLIYRGYDIHDLVRGKVSFEEIAHLLWLGHLPNTDELNDFKAKLGAQRELHDKVLAVLRLLPKDTDPMDALRTAVSVWGANARLEGQPSLDEAMTLTASVPLFLAAFHRLRNGHEPLTPKAELGYAANYLYLLTGQVPSESHARSLDAYLVLLADHGMNASTFTARVVASTWSDLASSVTAAIGALKGPLHGGAPGKVLEMLQAIGEVDKAEGWLRTALTRHERIMGFGHRVYKTVDPRAEELRILAQAAATPTDFGLALRVEELALRLLHEAQPHQRLYTNVEYYSASLMHAVGLPGDMFTPTFAASRTAGWTAHILEQVSDNRLIRPEANYTGVTNAKFVPLTER